MPSTEIDFNELTKMFGINKNQLEDFDSDLRELHEKLEVKDKFATWITRRINKYHFAENEDFFIISENREVIRSNGTKGGIY